MLRVLKTVIIQLHCSIMNYNKCAQAVCNPFRCSISRFTTSDRVSPNCVYCRIELEEIIDIIFSQISESQRSCHMVLYPMLADDDNSQPKEEQQHNQIKSGNRCCLELNAKHVSKTRIKGYYGFIHFTCIQASPAPATPTDHIHDGWSGG